MRKSKLQFKTRSPEETKKITEHLLQKAGNSQPNPKNALVVVLTGELGAGKTNLTQGVGDLFGIDRNITSPTFVIMKRYSIKEAHQTKVPNRQLKDLYHFDCYRVHSSEELVDLGWEDIVKDKNNIVFVEWGERVKDILPEDSVWVTMDSTSENERKIVVTY